MTKQQAEGMLKEATETIRSLNAQVVRGDEWNAKMQKAYSAGRLARYEIGRIATYTMAEGFRWNR